ncbi:unnamed protein product [Caenorhabditis nigoni]
MTLFQFLRWFCQLIHLGSYYKFLILMMYTLFGAWMFKTLESTPLTERIGETPALVINVPQDGFNFLKNFQETAAKMPDDLFLQFVKNQSDILFAAYKAQEEIEWTWCLGFFYSVETYTTIGYGYPVVRTWQARLATIIYAMIGVPFFLVYLASVGKTMSKTMARIDKRMRRTKFGKLLLYSRAPIANSEAPEEPFSIRIAVMMLIIWICFTSAFFSVLEGWTYATSAYFFIVTISTIGYGDLIFQNQNMIPFNLSLILNGMCLISMCFELTIKRIAKWKQNQFEKHMKKIQKMALLVYEKDLLVDDASGLGICMSPSLMELAATHVSEETIGFFGEMREWAYGAVIDHVIQSKLESNPDYVDDESDEDEGHKMQGMIVGSDEVGTRKARRRMSSAFKLRQTYHALITRIKAIEKAKPRKNDMNSIMFIKFLENKKVIKLLEQFKLPNQTTTSCQTDISGPVDQEKDQVMNAKIGSNSLQPTSSPLSIRSSKDDEIEVSLWSIAFKDLKFGGITEYFFYEDLIGQSTDSIYYLDEDYVTIPIHMLRQRTLQPPMSPLSSQASSLKTLVAQEQHDKNDSENPPKQRRRTLC